MPFVSCLGIGTAHQEALESSGFHAGFAKLPGGARRWRETFDGIALCLSSTTDDGESGRFSRALRIPEFPECDREN
jgi:hypothetical protein